MEYTTEVNNKYENKAEEIISEARLEVLMNSLTLPVKLFEYGGEE